VGEVEREKKLRGTSCIHVRMGLDEMGLGRHLSDGYLNELGTTHLAIDNILYDLALSTFFAPRSLV